MAKMKLEAYYESVVARSGTTVLGILGDPCVNRSTSMRRSKEGKTVTFEVSAWWNPEDKRIHLASNESDTLIATVGDDPKSEKRYHPKLFGELAKILREAGAPAPE